MKVQFIFLALGIWTSSAPQPRKLFHEHFEDFAYLIMEEVGDEINEMALQYFAFEEFQASINYIVTRHFRDLIYEMEDLPVFKAVVSFLESHDVDIEYFIDSVNKFVDSVQRRILRNSLKQISGRDPSAFIRDRMELFPKEKLTALYQKKLAEDEGFRRAMESFFSEEWNEIYSALWQNNAFLNEVAILKENGIDIELMFFECQAIMGLK